MTPPGASDPPPAAGGTRVPPLLVATPVRLSDPLHQLLTRTSFPDAFVTRLLLADIPQRVRYG